MIMLSASTLYSSFEGGLLYHSLQVYDCLEKKTSGSEYNVWRAQLDTDKVDADFFQGIPAFFRLRESHMPADGVPFHRFQFDIFLNHHHYGGGKCIFETRP